MTATAGQAGVMPDSAVLRAAILATEGSGADAALEWTDRGRLDGIVAAWIGRALPPGTPSSVAVDAAQRVTGGLAPFVEAEALRLAQAAVAAQQPQPAPELRADLEETLANWRDDAVYRPTDTRDEITEHYAVTECADTLAAVLAGHPDAEPQPAPELAAAMAESRSYRAALAQVASMAEAPGAARSVSNIAKVARRALEGK